MVLFTEDSHITLMPRLPSRQAQEKAQTLRNLVVPSQTDAIVPAPSTHIATHTMVMPNSPLPIMGRESKRSEKPNINASYFKKDIPHLGINYRRGKFVVVPKLFVVFIIGTGDFCQEVAPGQAFR